MSHHRYRSHSPNIFSSETTGPIKVKFHKEPPWDGGTKVFSNDPGHMTKMATMVKTFQDLLRNRLADIVETWYTASGAQVQPSLLK